MSGDPPYKRILLKLSGEALQGDRPFGLDPAVLDNIGAQLKNVQKTGEVRLATMRAELNENGKSASSCAGS